MSTLTIKVLNRLIEVDLGELDENGYFEGETWGGNLYLHVDGQEFGSIFVHAVPRATEPRVRIELGQYDHDEQEWVERTPIYALSPDDQIPLEENR